MNLTIANDALYKLVGEQESFRLIKEAGFDGVDLQSVDKIDPDIMLHQHVARAKETARLLADAGLICNLAHAPFRQLSFGMKFNLSDPVYRILVHSIEYAAIAGAKMIAIHGVPVPCGAQSSQSMAYNAAFFHSLARYAEPSGIRLALENTTAALPSPYQMNEMLDILNDPCFCALLDTGHAGICRTEPQQFICDLHMDALCALHIQDIHVKDARDEHLLPGMGTFDWDAILSALAQTGYVGDFNMEVHGFLRCFSAENLPAALKLAHDVGRSCIRKIEEYQAY